MCFGCGERRTDGFGRCGEDFQRELWQLRRHFWWGKGGEEVGWLRGVERQRRRTGLLSKTWRGQQGGRELMILEYKITYTR